MIEIMSKPRTGANEHGEQIEIEPFVICQVDADTLAGVDLREYYLWSADLRGRDLRGADLSGLSLHGTDFRGADLRGARLCRADLLNAQFGGALLEGADFTAARFLMARLEGADLRGAILTRAEQLCRCRYDERTIWPDGMEQPYAPERAASSLESRMASGLSPDEYAARHGRNTLVFSLDCWHYRDPAMQAWVRRFGEIIRNDALLREMEERYLTPEEVASIREPAEANVDV